MEGKHAFVTGASSGIGLQCAKQLLERGAKVTIVSRSAKKLQAASRDLAGLTSRLLIQPADVSDADQIDGAVSAAVDKFGEIGVLICCAGAAECKTFEDTTRQEFAGLLDVNYLGSVFAVKAVLPSMKRCGGGSIVLVSSQAGQLGLYGYTAYSPSKFALRGFAEALQMEVKPHDIFVSVCYPPDVDPPQYHYENKTKPAVTKQISGSGTPMKASRVAELILTGMARRHFTIAFGFDGFLLAVVTAGCSPANSIPALLLEVTCMPLARIIISVLLWTWNGLAKKDKKDL